MARPVGQTPAILVGLSFGSAIVLGALLLKRLRSWRKRREGQTLASGCKPLPSEEDNQIPISKAAERFEEAREAVELAAKNLSNDSLLQLYGLFKQATQGDCEQKEPSSFSFQAHSKWAAWNAHKGLSSEEAKANYVKLAVHLGLIGPSSKVQGSAARAGGARLGPVYSRPTLAGNEDHSTSSRGDRFCCMIAGGNIEAVRAAVTEDPSVVHATGEGGMTGLHFAADRGHAEIARMLLACGAKVNTQDDWGETPLHAAIAAEQQELVTMLVEAGTDTSLKNNEGKSCADLMIEEGHSLIDCRQRE